MSSLRVSDREAIARKIAKHRYGPQLEATHKAVTVIGDALYDALFDRKTQILMDSLPEGMLPETNKLTGRFGREDYSIAMSKERRVGMHDVRHDRDLTNAPAKIKALVQRGLEAQQAWKNLMRDQLSAERELRGILAGFTTFKRLREAWPEAADFIPSDPIPKGNAMTRVPAELNAKFGLPPSKKRAQKKA